MAMYGNHLSCDDCWAERCKARGENREPVRMKGGQLRPCCYCDELTSSGIYVRDAVINVNCGDGGPAHADE